MSNINIKTRPVHSGLKSEACLCILDIASSFFPSSATDLRPEKVPGRVLTSFELAVSKTTAENCCCFSTPDSSLTLDRAPGSCIATSEWSNF
jgi:hypothetical protein